MGVLDSLREEVYSTESLKTYELIRSTEPLLKPYPTFSSFLELMKKQGEESGRFQDEVLLRLIQLVQEDKHAETVQAWLVYRFTPKLKILQAKYSRVDNSDLFWSTLQAINSFRLWEGRQFVASALVKNIENNLKSTCKIAGTREKIESVDLEKIKSIAEPHILPDTEFDQDKSEAEVLHNLMDRFGISYELRFIFIKQYEGCSLKEIAEMLGMNYSTIRQRFSREKRRLLKKFKKS